MHKRNKPWSSTRHASERGKKFGKGIEVKRQTRKTDGAEAEERHGKKDAGTQARFE